MSSGETDLQGTDFLSPIKAARREKILNAAQHLFVRHGHRATTMEAVAEAAAMSKVTVYGYFKDKDVLFVAVAERLVSRLKSAVIDSLSGSGSLTVRVATALTKKHTIVYEVVRASPFANELFATKNQIAAQLFEDLDDEIEQLLAAALRSQGYKPRDAASKSKLLFGASLGIANRCKDLKQAKANIDELTSAILRKV